MNVTGGGSLFASVAGVMDFGIYIQLAYTVVGLLIGFYAAVATQDT